MKTLAEIQQELIQEYKLNTKIIIEDIPDIVLTYFNRVAKAYAEQALDLAAEECEADIILSTEHPSFDYAKVDKQSILKLKDQLK